MPRFLSDAWFEQLTNDDPPGEGPGLSIQQVVTGGPAGEVRYHFRVVDGSATVHIGNAGRPDVTFTEDYATAAAIASGKLTVQSAVLDGSITVSGDVGALVARREEVAGLDLIPAPVRAASTF